VLDGDGYDKCCLLGCDVVKSDIILRPRRGPVFSVVLEIADLVDVGNTVDVSEAHTASTFRVKGGSSV
jgi:hypothetical protein